MKCKHCNMEVDEKDVFCPHCGNKIEIEQSRTERNQQKRNKQKRKKRIKRINRIILFVCLSIIVVITILAVQVNLEKRKEKPKQENKIVLKENAYEIKIDETKKIEVTGTDLTFTSQNKKIVIVDKEGNITGKKLGKTIIHISNKDGDIASCTVNVIDDEKGQTVEEYNVDHIEEQHREYIISDSDTRLLVEADVISLSKEELALARNEIFARKGRIFESETLRTYFESKSWYHGTIEPKDFTADLLSDIELKNIEFINSYEKRDII